MLAEFLFNLTNACNVRRILFFFHIAKCLNSLNGVLCAVINGGGGEWEYVSISGGEISEITHPFGGAWRK